MKDWKTILLYFPLVYFSITSLTAQQPPSSIFCETDQAWHAFCQENPLSLARMQAIDEQIARGLYSTSASSRSVLTVPVVVHIIHNNGAANIPNSQVLQAITDLNDAFRNRAPFDPQNGVDTEIEFCLAKQDPVGNLTTGINRVVSPLTNMTSPTDDIALKNLSRWDPTQYVNIWVVNEVTSASSGPSVAGYAYLPAAHGGQQDGIVCEAQYFGASTLGARVQIHEAGHYFGLYHTFEGGCGNADCLRDGDRVCDTPPDASTTNMTCNSGINSCNTDSDDVSSNNPFRPLPFGMGDVSDMISNYMDYGDQGCQVAFTAGQKTRMRAALTTTRASLLTSPGCEIPCLSAISTNFTFSPANPIAGSAVTFTNSTTGATIYNWKVNGSTISTAASPTHTFTQSGSYQMTLVGSNSDPNCIDSLEISIQVNCPFAADFTASSTQLTSPGVVSFTNTSTAGASSYSWYLDGVFQANMTHWSHTFAAKGGYNIMLIASNGTCQDTTYGFVQIGSCNEGNRSNNWHFGNFAGISFSTGSPVAVTNGALRVDEGCSAISDKFGDLLMYSDGQNVYNRNHQTMPNGTGLQGHPSSTQSGLIVPVPDDDSLYYVFSLTQLGGADGATYSLVDMRLDNGFGDVTAIKNYPLISPVTEKLTAIKHANGTDTWVIFHGWNNSDFYAFLVTCGGIQTTPVVSTVTPLMAPGSGSLALNNALGQMKISPAGDKLAMGHYLSGFIYIYDFDPATGRLTNLVSFQGMRVPPHNFISTNGVYGVEFSPNGRYLYTLCGLCGNILSQFDLQAGNSAAIVASQVILGGGFGAMQLGPDGKIYIGQNFGSFLDVINNPNVGGVGAGYATNAVPLGGRSNRVGGLPSFVTSYFDEQEDEIIGDTLICENTDTATYTMPISACSDSVAWEIKGGGVAIGTTQSTITIAFGVFTPRIDTLIAHRYSTCGRTSDTLHIHILLTIITPVNLGADRAFCGNASLVLAPTAGSYTSYVWSTSATSSTITVSQPGTYILTAFNSAGCVSRDTIEILTDLQATPLDLGPDTCVCPGNIWALDAGSGYASYLWQDGSTQSTFTAYLPGTYYVTISDSCENSTSDTLVLTACGSPLVIDLGPDDLLANVDTLDAGTSGCSYLWSTGDTTQKIRILSQGTYSVWVNCNGCQAGDDIFLSDVVLSPELLFFEAVLLSEGAYQLQWEVNIPDHWRYFILEKGRTLDSFEEVGEIEVGNKSFRFIDHTPLAGTFYYRLKMYDYTGTVKLSNLLEVNPSLSTDWHIFPNPTSDFLYISTYLPPQKASIRVYDMWGKSLLVEAFWIENKPFSISSAGFSSGVYLLEIRTETTGQYIQKWVKK